MLIPPTLSWERLESALAKISTVSSLEEIRTRTAHRQSQPQGVARPFLE
jgi:hypothetical protein